MEDKDRKSAELEWGSISSIRLEDFGELALAEKKLLICSQRGSGPILSEVCPNFPEKISPADNIIRASFLRFLALGGDRSVPTQKNGVMLRGAWITGSLNLQGMETLPIHLAMCRFEQPPIFKDAHVCGTLWLRECYLLGLRAEQLRCDSGLSLDFTEIWGKVDLNSASIGSQFSARGATLRRLPRLLQHNSDGNAEFVDPEEDVLDAERIVVNGNVILDRGFVASGGIRFGAAKISGQFNMQGATLNHAKEYALTAERIEILGTAYLGNFEEQPFQSDGEIRLSGATINGQLAMPGAKLNSNTNSTIFLDGSTIHGGIHMASGFEATGKISLIRARVSNELSFKFATLNENASGVAIAADGIKIDGALICKGLRSYGTLSFQGASISGQVSFEGNEINGKGVTLNLQSADIGSGFIFREQKHAVSRIDVSHANVAVLVDEPKAWGTDLILDGFKYSQFGGNSPKDIYTRIDWLKRQSNDHLASKDHFRPQPWQQLIRTLRETGHAGDAVLVAIEFEKQRAKADKIGSISSHTTGPSQYLNRAFARVLHYVFGITMGYGYKPLRLIIITFFVWLGFSGLYAIAGNNRYFVSAANTNTTFQNIEVCGVDRTGICTHLKWNEISKIEFHPFIFSLDVMLPLTKLGEENKWKVAEDGGGFSEALQFLIWFQTIFGWVLGLMIVAVFSGLPKRQID